MPRKFKVGIRPDYFAPIRPRLPKQADEATDNADEQALAGLANHDGWRVLVAFIEQEIDNLEQINKTAIEAGATFDEIGRNAVLVQLCKEELLRVIQKVTDARESINTGGTLK